jgi:DNA-binding XRE family transcriptional regulator
MGTRGPKPDEARRQAVAVLRAQGLSFAQIGARLGMSRECAWELFKRSGLSVCGPGIQCCACGAEIASRTGAGQPNGRVRCLTCVATDPAATFGQRLKAHRVAAGLTLQRLSELTGINFHTLGDYEQERMMPNWLNVMPLIRFFGVSLVDLNNELGGDQRGADKLLEGPRSRGKVK